MTQEEKDLLLKDICGRLPYGVIVKDRNGVHKLTAGNTEFTDLLYNGKCNIRPYLFPLSSLTEEQTEEYYSLADDVTIERGKGSYFGIKIHCIKLGISDNPHEGVWDQIDLDAIDWLNAHHFDYRGLIEKGLAIDATNLNIY
jgi:hypothetical protein